VALVPASGAKPHGGKAHKTKVRTVGPIGPSFHLRQDLRVRGRAHEAICGAGSSVVGAAYRCIDQGRHFVLDPCYPGWSKKGSIRFYCLLRPWERKVEELLVSDWESLPPSIKPNREVPWALQTTTGHRCVYSSGSHDAVNGVPVWWNCKRDYALLGDLDRSHGRWEATLVRYHSDTGTYEILGAQKIKTAWFGKRARNP
jgi:hypothetical protein